MQEVFEKIIEKLELKSYWTQSTFDEDGYSNDDSEEVIELYDAIEIVKQTEEEYKGGWIPCSERLPKVEDLHEKSIEDCERFLVQRRCGVMEVAHYIKVYGESYFSAHAMKITDIIAWQPLPEPWKGEHD